MGAVPPSTPASPGGRWPSGPLRRLLRRDGRSPVVPAGVARPGRLPARYGPDGLVVAGYLALAGMLVSRQWRHPDQVFHQGSDQILFEWMLARTARAITHLDNPLFSTQVGAPDGVNLMANTSVLGLGVPLTPLTLLAGSQVAFLVAVVAGFAGTATAWYVFLRRRLVDSRVAAAIGGLVCGFAPGMVAQGSAHLHMVAQFLVPAILAVLFDPRTDRVVRRGVLLGLLVTYQVFLGEEVLFLLGLAVGLAVVVWAVVDPVTARRVGPAFLGRVGVGVLTALPLLAYPLHTQFLGPGHYRGLPFHPHAYVLDVSSYAAAARQTLTGTAGVAGRLAPNATEENSFFGLPLLALTVLVACWLWRRPLVRVLAVCGTAAALLSLGPQIRVDGRVSGVPGPYQLVADWPLLDLAVPARFALVCVPVIGVLLALSVDRVDRAATVGVPAGGTHDEHQHPGRRPARVGDRVPLRLLWIGAVVAVLLPAAPTPIRTAPVAPVPEFVSSGRWRAYVPPGRTLVQVPPGWGHESLAGTYWSARAGVPFAVPGGYFIGPTSENDPQARWGAPPRPTGELLNLVAATGQAPAVTDEQRRQAVEDLRYWRAAVVVLGDLRFGGAVKNTLDQLVGPGQPVGGVWLWDVRGRVG